MQQQLRCTKKAQQQLVQKHETKERSNISI